MIERRTTIGARTSLQALRRLTWGNLLVGALIIIVALIVFVPLLWMVLSSF
jgi:ABC-type glycerol-3-phosphate transport system permease component